MKTKNDEPRVISCAGHHDIQHNYRGTQRNHKVAMWIIDKDISVSGPVREELVSFIEGWNRSLSSTAESVINTYEPQVP